MLSVTCSYALSIYIIKSFMIFTKVIFRVTVHHVQHFTLFEPPQGHPTQYSTSKPPHNDHSLINESLRKTWQTHRQTNTIIIYNSNIYSCWKLSCMFIYFVFLHQSHIYYIHVENSVACSCELFIYIIMSSNLYPCWKLSKMFMCLIFLQS